MLSDRLYKCVELAFYPWINYLCIFHYTWNPQTLFFVKVSYNKKETRMNHFNKIVLILWILFHLIGLIKFYLNRDVNSIIFLITVVIAQALVSICWFLCIYSEHAWFSTLNSVIIFVRYINGECSLQLKIWIEMLGNLTNFYFILCSNLHAFI